MKKTEHDIENLIRDNLNSDKPDKTVLLAAKELMRDDKKELTRRRKEVSKNSLNTNKLNKQELCPVSNIVLDIKDGLSNVEGGGNIKTKKIISGRLKLFLFISIILVLIVCFVPVALKKQGDIVSDTTMQEIISIKSYNSEMLYLDYDVESSILYSNTSGSPTYIKETYKDGDITIELYVLIDISQSELSFMEMFDDLYEISYIGDSLVYYGKVDDIYCAKVSYDSYEYFLSADVLSYEEILFYMQNLIL